MPTSAPCGSWGIRRSEPARSPGGATATQPYPCHPPATHPPAARYRPKQMFTPHNKQQHKPIIALTLCVVKAKMKTVSSNSYIHFSWGDILMLRTCILSGSVIIFNSLILQTPLHNFYLKFVRLSSDNTFIFFTSLNSNYDLKQFKIAYSY